MQNSRKARDGGLVGLLDPELMAKKKADEEQLLAAVAKNPALKDSSSAWKNVADAQKVRAAIVHRYTVLERGAGFNSTLFEIARTLVRSAEEKTKPERDRPADAGRTERRGRFGIWAQPAC